MGLTLEQLDPVEAVITPDPATVELYRRLRPQVEHVAAAVLAATEEFPWTDSGPPVGGVLVELAYGAEGRRWRCPTTPR
jgi:hypothetical protein